MKQDLYKICSILVIIIAMASFIYACKDTLEKSQNIKSDHRFESLGRDLQQNVKIGRLAITDFVKVKEDNYGWLI